MKTITVDGKRYTITHRGDGIIDIKGHGQWISRRTDDACSDLRKFVTDAIRDAIQRRIEAGKQLRRDVFGKED